MSNLFIKTTVFSSNIKTTFQKPKNTIYEFLLLVSLGLTGDKGGDSR